MMNSIKFLLNIIIVTIITIFQSSSVFGYESEPPANLSEILSPELTQSAHHRIDEVNSDGKFYQFRVDSDFGIYHISSVSMLRLRVKEIIILGHAINQFGHRDNKLSNELRGQFSISADNALDILAQPISSASNLAGQLADNLNETLTGVPAGKPKTESPRSGAVIADPVNAMHKRNVANQWDLDVYSTNPKVQEFLNTVARTRSSGNISAGAPALNRRYGKPSNISNALLEVEIRTILKSKNIIELTEINNELLKRMSINKKIRDKFLQHTDYSPSNKTRISLYLSKLDTVRNRSSLLEAAVDIPSEQMVHVFEDGVMMLLYYHHNISSLQKLYAGKDILQAITNDNLIVYFSPLDFIYWSEESEKLFDRLLKRAGMAGFNGWELVNSGTISVEAKKNLKQRNFTFRDKFVH